MTVVGIYLVLIGYFHDVDSPTEDVKRRMKSYILATNHLSRIRQYELSLLTNGDPLIQRYQMVKY